MVSFLPLCKELKKSQEVRFGLDKILECVCISELPPHLGLSPYLNLVLTSSPNKTLKSLI